MLNKISLFIQWQLFLIIQNHETTLYIVSKAFDYVR